MDADEPTHSEHTERLLFEKASGVSEGQQAAFKAGLLPPREPAGVEPPVAQARSGTLDSLGFERTATRTWIMLSSRRFNYLSGYSGNKGPKWWWAL